MTITVRSPLGVYYRCEVPAEIDTVLAGNETAAERERVERGIAALALHESGFSYAAIAWALELTKTTAFRRVQHARRRYRKAARALGAELAR